MSSWRFSSACVVLRQHRRLLALLLAALAMFAVQLVAPASAGASLHAASGLTAGYDGISFSYDEVLVPVDSESVRHVGPQARGASQVTAVGSVVRPARNICDLPVSFVAPSGIRTFSSSGARAANGAVISLDDAAAVAARNGIDMRMIKLEFESGQPLHLYGYMSQNGAGQVFRAPDGRFVITLTDAGLSSPEAALNTIAHELNHIREVLNSPAGHFVTDEAAATAAGNAAERFFR